MPEVLSEHLYTVDLLAWLPAERPQGSAPGAILTRSLPRGFALPGAFPGMVPPLPRRNARGG